VNEEQARRLLRLERPYTHEEIGAAYRRACAALKDTPPDMREEVVSRLNRSRDLLLEGLGPRPGRDLVLRTTAVSALELPQVPAAEVEVRRENTHRTVRNVTLNHVGRLARLRRTETLLSIVAGGFAVIALILRFTNPEYSETRRGTDIAFYAAFGAGAAVLLAALSWWTSGRETWLRLEIEGVSDTLADRATLADLLDEIDAGPAWTRAQFEAAVGRWIRDTPPRARPWVSLRRALRLPMVGRDEPESLAAVARRLGHLDTARLVLAKATELGLVEDRIVETKAGLRHGYARVMLERASSGPQNSR
jgi:hypothetical protein